MKRSGFFRTSDRQHDASSHGIVDVPRCGARTRAGHPFRRRGRGAGGRCINHGGASTGARTPEGRAKISQVQRLRWQRWRAARGIPEG